jgi:hypothetical protein
VAPEPEFVVDFSTLGFLIADWIEQHCIVPDGFSKGKPYVMADWQLWCTVNHYRVRDDAQWDPEMPRVSTNFVYRRSQVVAPQKALAIDTLIPTPSGWTTMGEVQPGDFVFDERGEPTRVVSKSQVWMSQTYRVTFSDGAELVACGDHQWWVERRTPSATYVPDRVRTEDLIGNLVDAHGARRFRVPMARPIAPPRRGLPVDPYVLGAWLGDGHSDDGRLTGLDREVFDRIALAGYEVRQTTLAKRVQVMGLRTHLREAGVLKNKHIPQVYLRASEKQRWALLQGLMDTDGTANTRQGRCEFTTTLPALRDGMRDLLWSLGIKHVCHEGIARLNGRATGPKWRISFGARSDMPVFHLERKQGRLKAPTHGHAQYGHRRIVAVEEVPTVPTQCLTVEAESHVFLAGREMIPTCNTGKGPWAAAIICAEALGPTVFIGWAAGGEVYACADHGCECGWEYEYEPGEPMGMPRPTPLIQLTATSKDQTFNVYRPLKAMFKGGWLTGEAKTGEEFIRLPDDGRIDTVTSSARARLGNPVTFVIQDETGIYTKSNGMAEVATTQRRGLAGMDARSIETTNCWNPAEQSIAQSTFESRAPDVFKFYRKPPAHLSYKNKAERAKIHRYVYEGSWWVNQDAIEGEAAELLETDPAQAERFFGNRPVSGAGSWLRDGLWDQAQRSSAEDPAGRLSVCLSFDGSDVDDHSVIRAETLDGWQFTPTYGPDRRPTVWSPAEWGGSIPRSEVHAAMADLFEHYAVRRVYCDPKDWKTEIEDWALEYGEKVVIQWATYRVVQMYEALKRFVTDLGSMDNEGRLVRPGTLTHDGCPITALHVGNARKLARPGDRYILGKPSQGQKIDAAVASVLAHEAAADARVDGWGRVEVDTRVFVLS